MDIIIFLKAMGNLVFAALVFFAMLVTTLFYFLMYFVKKQGKMLPLMLPKARLPIISLLNYFRKSASDAAKTLAVR